MQEIMNHWLYIYPKKLSNCAVPTVLDWIGLEELKCSSRGVWLAFSLFDPVHFQFRLWYHMFGSDIGSLNIYYRTGVGAYLTPLFSRSGHTNDYWELADVAVTSDYNFQVKLCLFVASFISFFFFLLSILLFAVFLCLFLLFACYFPSLVFFFLPFFLFLSSFSPFSLVSILRYFSSCFLLSCSVFPYSIIVFLITGVHYLHLFLDFVYFVLLI